MNGNFRTASSSANYVFSRIIADLSGIMLLATTLFVPRLVFAGDMNEYGVYVFAGGSPISATEVNDNFGMLCQGLETFQSAIHVDGKRNVGIGTDTPLADVDIYGNLSEPLTGRVAKNSGSNDLFGSGTLFTEELNVGDPILIGDEVFTVASIQSDTQLKLDAPAGSGVADAIAYTDSDLFVVHGGDGVDRFVIDKSGYVGIGTTTPEAMLVVNGSSESAVLIGSEIAAGENTIGNAHGALNFYGTAPGGDNFFEANARQRVVSVADRAFVDYRTESGGRGTWILGSQFNSQSDIFTVNGKTANVGIGTTAPEARLHIAGGDDSLISLQNVNGGGTWRIYSTGDGNSEGPGHLLFRNPPGVRLLIQDNGNVGIGTTSPAYKLDVAGQLRADNVAVSSDARLKTDIYPVLDALDGITCLQGVTYRWADPSAPQDLQLGLIAQEVETCFPEVVSTDEDGYKSVAYGRLVAPLVEAVKEQQHMISSQEQKIARQNEVIVRQEAELTIHRRAIADMATRLAKIESLLNDSK